MPRPAASVIIGVYNRAGPIVPCVESLLASTARDFEIVLVDDGSTDDSAAVLERLREAAPDRIRVLLNARNRGASGARNVGLDAARGELCLFTDSDCRVEPGWVAAMIEGLRRTGAAAVSGTVLDKPPANPAERAYAGSCLVSRKAPVLMESNMGLRAALGFRFDEALFGGEGDDLSDRLREAGHAVALVPEAIVHHHHPLDLAAYLRMGRQQGRGHALYWYKHGRLVGRDVLFSSLALLCLPLGLVDRWLLAVPASLLGLQICAILFNEVHYKGKPLARALSVLPVQVLYYAVRTWSVLATRLRVHLGKERAIEASRRQWRLGRSASAPRT